MDEAALNESVTEASPMTDESVTDEVRDRRVRDEDESARRAVPSEAGADESAWLTSPRTSRPATSRSRKTSFFLELKCWEGGTVQFVPPLIGLYRRGSERGNRRHSRLSNAWAPR